MPKTTLERFLDAYIITALWSSLDDDDNPLDKNYDKRNLAPSALEIMRKDCETFLQAGGGALMDEAIETGKVKCGPDFDELERGGHDFWLTQNRHGAGFWGGDWPGPYGEKLTEICRKFPERNLYVADDGDEKRIFIA